MKKFYITTLALAVILGVGCKSKKSKTAKAVKTDHGFPLSNIDSSYSPCTDFYDFAIGGWLKNNPIPKTESSWGTFGIVAKRNRMHIKEILDSIVKITNTQKGSDVQLVSDFYQAAMDSAKANQLGYTPIKPMLAEIQACKSIDDIIKTMVDFNKKGSGAFFSYGVGQGPKNSTQYITFISEGGTTLPDKSYYFPKSPQGKKMLNDYKNYIAKMFTLVGIDSNDAAKGAANVLSLETTLAKANLDRDVARQIDSTYHLLHRKDLEAIAPNINWEDFFNESGLSKADSFIVDNPRFFKVLNKEMTTKNLGQLKDYMTFQIINDFAFYLSMKIYKVKFDFYAQYFTGVTQMPLRWRRALSATNSHVGMELGKLFVKQYFTQATKDKVKGMINNMVTVFGDRVKKLDWMSDSTKKKALEKLSKFTVKIGYPDKWKDYSSIAISKDNYVQNVINCNIWRYNDNINHLGKPIDRHEWGMLPQMVNAYYNQSMNEIVFPAGILQPPFFDPKADDAMNYGGVVAVIGHEMTHGFDDEGHKYNGDGNLDNWWTSEDSARFAAKTKLLEQQFDGYKIDGASLNGKLTMGENIADLGGVTIAFNALKLSLKGKPTPKPIDGFTWQQRFFLSWAQIWHTNMKKQRAVMLTKTDPHSPAKFRVNGPLSNLPAFAKAWGCKPGDKMVRPDSLRVKIW